MYVDPQKARQERERQERERQARIKAEKERKAREKAKAEAEARAREKAKKAREKAKAEAEAKAKAEATDPKSAKKPQSVKKGEPTPAKPPTQESITWSKPGQLNPIYGSSAPLYEQPSVPIAKKSEPKPKKPDDRKARTWTGEEPDPVVIAAPHSIHPSVKEQLLATDFEGFKAEQLLKKEQRKQAKQAKFEQAASDKTAQEQNGQTHPKKGDSRFPSPLLSDLLASPTLNLNTPEVPMFGGIGSVEPTLVAGPPQYSRGWDFEAITSKPMRRNIDVEVAALQQKYKNKDAQFFRHLVQMRQEQIQKQQAVLQHVSNGGNYHNAAQIYGYNGINPGTFSLTNHTQNPETGNHNYGVSFDLAAAKYYNKIAGVEWVKWNQEKARIAAAELQGERNAREFIANLPNASAQDKEQLAQVKQRQIQIKQYDASLRQHQSTHERMAANAPVEKLNFNNQYVVPGSLTSANTQPQPQTMMPTQASTSNNPNPFSVSLPGTQQGEEASQYWANLYVQGEQQGGLGGFAKQAVAFPLGMLSSLWTKDTALDTSLTLGTAGLGAVAGAGRLGAASMPVVRGLQFGGAVQSGMSIGQGLSGKNMFTGEDLSPFDRGLHLTFGALGAGLDLGGAGLTRSNLSQSMPTFSRLIEGVSPQNATLQSGRLGNQTGAVRLGGESEPNLNEPTLTKGEKTVNRKVPQETEPAKDLTLKAKSTSKQKSQYKVYVDYAKGYGKEIGHYDATTNPGPLGPSPKAIERYGGKGALQRSAASTFAGGRYTTIELEQPITVYRAWSPGTQSKELGSYWSLEKPQGSLQTTIDSAVKPEWSHLLDNNGKKLPGRSQATKWVAIEVQPGTQINVGQVGSQGGMWVGGGSQVFIDRNLINETLIRTRGDLQ